MEFDAIIKEVTDYPNAAFVEIPFDVEKEFGKKGRIKIKASFDGIPYRGSILKMGTPFYTLLVLKEIRYKLNKTHGDSLHIIISVDTEERKVIIPEYLTIELNKNKTAAAAWQKLSYTFQKEYVNSLTSAKKEETRQKRLKQLIEKLNQ